MQPHSSRGNGGRREGPAGAGEMEGLLAELRRVLERITVVGPPETVTVPLALPMDLAELMVIQAERRGLGAQTTPLDVSCLYHGQYHAARENGLDDLARDIARMIRRMAPPQEWARFVAQHPEAREGL